MRKTEHLLLLTWILTMGLVVFGAWVTVDSGLFADLLYTDRSYVCVLLIAMYAVCAAHSLVRTSYLSTQLNHVAHAERVLAAAGGESLELSAGGVTTARGVTLPASFFVDYVRDLARARMAEPAASGETSAASSDLLEAYAAKLRGQHEFGWFMIDLMLKIGFLGTLIGFIWMLSSVSRESVIDAASMQHVLKDMSYGMAIALNTTLTSLVTATLVSAPYYLLGRALDELVECTVRLTQVEILPRLAPAS